MKISPLPAVLFSPKMVFYLLLTCNLALDGLWFLSYFAYVRFGINLIWDCKFFEREAMPWNHRPLQSQRPEKRNWGSENRSYANATEPFVCQSAPPFPSGETSDLVRKCILSAPANGRGWPSVEGCGLRRCLKFLQRMTAFHESTSFPVELW